MKPLSSIKPEHKFTSSVQLKPGAYVLKILDVKYINGVNGNSDRIDIRFDVAEGENTDFFKKQYESNTNEDRKWKGKGTLWVPTEDGSEDDERTIKSFNEFLACLEDENKGYRWDNEESKWKGLKIGGTFRTENNIIEGRACSYTSFAWFTSAESVRNGTAKLPNVKNRNGATGSGSASSNTDFLVISGQTSEEVPF